MFQHLHIHNEYSVLDGYGTAKQYTEHAAEMNLTHLALTNHGNIDGAIGWQQACLKQGLLPIQGTEAYVVPDMSRKFKSERRGHITFLVENLQGWIELCRMLTVANLEGFYHKPRIDYAMLCEMHLSGLIILTGCAGSFLSLQGADEVFDTLYQKGARLYLEVMPHNIPIQLEHHKLLADYVHRYPEAPRVATNDCHYVARSEWQAQETLLAIQTGAKWDDPKRWTFGFRGLHLRSEQEMFKAFQRQGCFTDREIEDALDVAGEIAKLCGEFRIPERDINLPVMADDSAKELKQLCINALKAKGLASNPLYMDQYNEEYKLIVEKGFEDYFLIVHDLIRYAAAVDIMISPGRGSVGGCLIAYLLDVHKLDPIFHQLSFSRFLNADRNDWPDIDLDFEMERRPEIVTYIEKKYGKYNTCGITTDSRLKGLSVLNDIGKMHRVPQEEISTVKKLIDINLKHDAVKTCMEDTRAGVEFYSAHKDVALMAMKLEGQLRQHGLHPGAVVISADDLRDGQRGNLKIQKGRVVSCFDMEDAETSGLMKLDILGLSTLSVLHYTRDLINESNNIDFDFDTIPFDDPKVFKEISQGNTSGLFQITGWATTNMAKEMIINELKDIVALIALVRPGIADSGMAKMYLDRSKGGTYARQHPIYEEVTHDTFGILLYQEQIMQVVSKVAGMSESDADKVRKIIAKKRDLAELEEYKEKFITGCQQMGTFDAKQADSFWATLDELGKYSFNKAHSTGYAILGYWTAYCKVNYPGEFLAACLTYDGKEDKQHFIQDAYRYGYTVQYPKVGISDPLKWTIQDKTLYAPFNEIINVGEVEALKAAGHDQKGKGKMKGFFDMKPVVSQQSTIGQVLKEIDAFDPDSVLGPEKAKKLMKFVIDPDAKPAAQNQQVDNIDQYPRLRSLLLELDPVYSSEKWFDIPDEFVNAVSLPSGIIKKTGADTSTAFQTALLGDLKDCGSCPLGQQTEFGPVYPSFGRYNIMILGEAPEPEEDREGYGFYEQAPAGELLWTTFAEYKLPPRSYYYVTNVCKCYPRDKGKPDYVDIDQCYNLWLKAEIQRIQPRIILALGNTPLYALTGRKGGIQAMSGKVEWIEQIEAWVVWAAHPASVKRDGNAKYFQRGIEAFYTTLLRAWER